MAKIPLTGGAYMAHSVVASAQRSVNLFSEPVPEAQGEPMPAAHYPTSGSKLLATIGTGPIRGIRQCTTGGVYVVSGDGVYSINVSDWTGTLLGSITPGLRTPVSMADNGLDMVIVDGTASGWRVNLAANTFAPIVDSGGMFSGATRVDYLDTFFVLNKPNTPQFHWSGPLAVTFDPLDFANKQSYSDQLVTLIVAKREIWLLGERTSEVWYDAGPTDIGAGSSQFAQVQSVFIDHGIAAKYSVANYDNGVFWLTRDRQGQGFVIHGAGYQTKRVSTYAIEAEIGGYTRIDDAIGFCYQTGGHTFYVLTFPHADKTWSFDITTGLWHEWLWIDSNGNEHRHRANCFWPVNSTLVVGDWQNGSLYELRRDVYTDNGQPIKRLRSFPHIVNDGKRVFYRQFIADMETGTSSAVAPDDLTLIDARFTAADGINLDAYISDVGGGWVAVGGEDNAAIADNRLVGLGGEAMYASATAPPRPDYSVRFNVVPPSYDSVVSGTSLWAIGRAAAINTGYRIRVSADGVQYTLTLSGGAGSGTVAMGTLASGWYTVWLVLRGTTIVAQVQRSQDGLWLRGDGVWLSNQGTAAVQFTDSTYTAAGLVVIGGVWPVPDDDLIVTAETRLTPDPNFPSGYTYQLTLFGGPTQSFDFANNLYYAAVFGSGNFGVAITDLSTMAVTRTTTLSQMYAGTAFGPTPGVPWSQDIWDLVCGNDTDLFLLTGPDHVITHMTRVDPATMKVTGEFYVSTAAPPPIANVVGAYGAVNKTSGHTIVAYRTLPALNLGPMVFDGTSLTPIGLATTPTYNANQTSIMPGAVNPDGSCDFIMLNYDRTGGSGNVDIWRINVSDGLVMTTTKTGTVNILPVFSPGADLWLGQANYDTTHDCVILWLQPAVNGPPTYIVSADFDGSINWTQGPLSVATVAGNRGQSLLTGSSLMVGQGTSLTLIDTSTGAITFTGSAFSGSGYFFEVWDAERRAYWTYVLATFGFIRVSFPASGLAMDNVVCTTKPVLSQNLVSLRWSDDRGHSYGSPVSQSIGEIGEYRTSLSWQRLGMCRDRAFEIFWSVPMPTALQGCWIEVTPAQS